MKQDGKFFYGWIVVIGGVIIVSFAIPLINALSSLFTIPITEEMGLSRSQFALCGTIVSVMTVFMSPIAGKLYASHKFKLRTVQTTALFVLALAYGSYVLAHNNIQLYISAFFIGLAFITAGMIPTSIMISNWFVKKRGIAMSIAMMGISIGPMIFSPFMTFLIQDYGWRTCRLVMMVLMLVICLPISFFVMKEKPEDVGQRAYGGKEALEEKLAKAKAQGEDAQKTVTVENNIPLRYSRKFAFFYVLAAGMLFNGFLAGGVIQHYNPFLQENFGPATAAWLISLGSAVAIVAKLIVGWIFDRLGNRKCMIISGFSGAAVYLVYAFLGTNLTAMICTIFFDGLGTSIQTMGINLLTASIFGAANYSENYGYMKMSQQAGMAIGAIVIAFIFDSLGSYQMAWVACSVMMLLSAISIIYADYKAKQLNPKVQEMIAAETAQDKQTA